MNLDLTGKIALVTGSSRGIGLAAATGLAQMGAEVIVNGREATAVANAIAKIRKAAPAANTHAAVIDLGGAKGCAGLVAQFPEVDILVNNLGIYEPKTFFRYRGRRLDQDVRGQRHERCAPYPALSEADAGEQGLGPRRFCVE